MHFVQSYTYYSTDGSPWGASLISMISNPTVSYDTITNDSKGDSSAGTVTHIGDYVQAINLDPYDVSLSTNYKCTLLKEINANWDDGPSDSAASVPALTHVASTYDDVPSTSDDRCFYDALDTEQVKAMLSEC
jgi:hypothetical protein